MSNKCESPCRCQYVQRWLDVHEKYFPDPPRPARNIQSTQTYVANRTTSTNQINYYTKLKQYGSQVVQAPCIPAPHRISPMKPIYKS